MPRKSLTWTLAIPLTAVAVGAAAGLWLIDSYRQKIELLTLAESVAVGYESAICSGVSMDPTFGPRLLNSVGAHREVVLVLYGSASEILASSHERWVGEHWTELREGPFVAEVSAAFASVHAGNPVRSILQGTYLIYGSPMIMINDQGRQISGASVLILDLNEMRRVVETQSLITTTFTFATLIVMVAIVAWLLHVRVLRRLLHINQRLATPRYSSMKLHGTRILTNSGK